MGGEEGPEEANQDRCQHRFAEAHGLLHQDAVDQFAQPPLTRPDVQNVLLRRRPWGRGEADARQWHRPEAGEQIQDCHANLPSMSNPTSPSCQTLPECSRLTALPPVPTGVATHRPGNSCIPLPTAVQWPLSLCRLLRHPSTGASLMRRRTKKKSAKSHPQATTQTKAAPAARRDPQGGKAKDGATRKQPKLSRLHRPEGM